MWKQREMPGFMADITPYVGQHRGDEIARWLEECKADCNYVIIDDLSAENFNSDQFDKLVVVNPLYGLDRNALRLAEAILVRQITKSDA